MSDRNHNPASPERPAVPATITPDPTVGDPTVSRRGALIRMLEIGLGIAGAVILTSGATESQAEARKVIAHPPPPKEPQLPLVSLAVVHPDGGSYPAFEDNGQLWIGGSEGERYDLQVQNHSNGRVEVVVSVDGRDVISGKIGDYRKQRGYVLEPFGSLTIEGYRQSLDRVAAFRFAALADSYSARMGTPENVGVIGVAVFAEKSREPRRKNPLAPVVADPFPGEGNDRSEEVAPAAPAASEARITRGAADKRKGGALGEADGGSWAAPEPINQLGTEYGESTFAPVEEVEFKRANKKRPDQLLVVRYDSLDGLRARGIVNDPVWRPEPEPRPWIDREPQPRREFAPPPPPRDWWK